MIKRFISTVLLSTSLMTHSYGTQKLSAETLEIARSLSKLHSMPFFSFSKKADMKKTIFTTPTKKAKKINTNDIEKYILKNFKDVHPLDSWGEKGFFLNPGQQLKRGTYFATLKEKDGDNDKASYLDREGIFRLNMGVSKERYLSLFQSLPKRPAKGCFIDGDYDFQKLDTILPHPVYGWMGWICVLNPSSEIFEECKEFLDDAYKKATKATIKKLSK